MPNVYMDSVPVVQTIGPNGIGVYPPVPIEKVEKIDGSVREMKELTSPAGRLPNPIGEIDGLIMHTKDEAWQKSGEIITLEKDVEDLKKYADIKSPADLKAIAASGKAREYFDIGDIIYIPWTNYTPSTPVTYYVPFAVVHFGDAYDEDGVKHENPIWLMSVYAQPEEIPFDAAEDTVVDLTSEPNALEGWYYWGLTGTSYTALNLSAGTAIPDTYDSVHKCGVNNLDVLRYGYNRWKASAYRQWLNSDAAKNENWWESQHTGDIAPTTTYTNKPGWLYGFAPEWREIFQKVKVDTAANTVTDSGVTDTTYDYFFLPSLEQMYGSPQAAGVEGDYWEYWKEETGLDAPSNGSASDTNDARKIPPVTNFHASAVNCRLRSATRSNSHYVWYVYYAGYLYGYIFANGAYRAQPACVIF